MYGSRFSTPDVTVWAAVNRATPTTDGAVIDPTPSATASGPYVLDLGAGRLLTGGDLSVTVPARGVAAIVGVVGDVPEPIAACLAAAAADPHVDDSAVSGAGRRPYADRGVDGHPPGRRHRRRSRRHSCTVTYRRRETGMYDGAPYVDEWKPLSPRLHDTGRSRVVVTVRAVAVAAREVTNGEFGEFVAATGYRPLVANRFLRHWVGGEPPADRAATAP